MLRDELGNDGLRSVATNVDRSVALSLLVCYACVLKCSSCFVFSLKCCSYGCVVSGVVLASCEVK